MKLLDIDTITALRCELIEMDQRHELDDAVLVVKKGRSYVVFSSCDEGGTMEGIGQMIESYLGSMDFRPVAMSIPEKSNKEG
ncbi:hypothetical protein [Runella zeae]|uniref:hypothetical protein n=1 Tax=Runella zeae TaxID=94255 RepID=UPI002356A3A2|nr:hypothetical protein [Runella zeae]